ncbi:MAG: hypothetical protein AUK63_1623 [bacterium P3]|nr:MAG: hypothetical protein AUK63_1623 [bacterium P3]KWW39001.1 MAG: hypothetical protein F083_1961 [bacterium F083]
MRRFLTIALLLSVVTTAPAGTPLGDGAVVSLLTCGEGGEVETFFGHSAIRVRDTANGIDYVYNYGTYDFNQPHFYWSFARGNLNYCLSRDSYRHFMQCYRAERRAVYEQRLMLDGRERENLFILLETNYEPEYRYYRYDFFRDNCATRPRDVIDAALGRRSIRYNEPVQRITYRDVVYGATAGHLWWRFALDLVLGMPTDHVCNARELMFAPFHLMQLAGSATLDDGQPLSSPATELLPGEQTATSCPVSPLAAGWGLFVVIVVLSMTGSRRGWSLRWIDCILYGTGFLVSLLLIFLWFGTSHHYTNWNLNLLWASPLWLYFLIRGRQSARWMTVVQMTMLAAAMVLTLIGVPQQINSAVVPLSLTLFVRLTASLHENHKQQ